MYTPIPPVDDTALIVIISVSLLVGIVVGICGTLSVLEARSRRAFNARVRRAARSNAMLYTPPATHIERATRRPAPARRAAR